MRLAKSQAHQPFPGFLGPGFFLSNHRCKSLFQSVCPDSNRAFSLFGQMHSASALFERRFSRLAAVFFSKNSQRLGRRFVGPDGLRKRRPFSISKRALAAASETAGRRRPLRPHFFTTGGSLTWTTKTQVVSSATLKKSVFPCTVQALEPCRWRERAVACPLERCTPLPHHRQGQRVLSPGGCGHAPGRGCPVSRRGHRREDAGVYDHYGNRPTAQSQRAGWRLPYPR